MEGKRERQERKTGGPEQQSKGKPKKRKIRQQKLFNKFKRKE